MIALLLLCVKVRVKEQEKQLQRTFTEKEKQLQETQVSVARKLGEAEHRVLTLQTGMPALSVNMNLDNHIQGLSKTVSDSLWLVQ